MGVVNIHYLRFHLLNFMISIQVILSNKTGLLNFYLGIGFLSFKCNWLVSLYGSHLLIHFFRILHQACLFTYWFFFSFYFLCFT